MTDAKFPLAGLFGALIFVANAFASSPLTVRHPISTPFGIVFTNELGSGLYLAHGDTTEEIFSSPGCGEYFTLSPDMSTIGFKEIFNDGTQAPALLDIAMGKVTFLHSPVPQSGQVSFAANGDVAYSIVDTIFSRSGDSVKAFDIETYSNIVTVSADGKKLAYTDRRGYIYAFDTRSKQTTKISGAGYMLPIWSPVGQRLCYSTLNGKLSVYDAGNGETNSLGDGSDPAWMPDGASLLVVRRRIVADSLVSSHLYRISYDGKETVQLTTAQNSFERQPSVSPDGAVLYCTYNNTAIYKATFKNGAFERKTSIGVNSKNILPLKSSDRSTVTSESEPRELTPSATPYFEVPYVNQVWDTPYGFGSLGSSACGPTSAIMVIAYYNLLPPWNNQLAVPMKHVSAWGNYVLEPYHFHSVYFSIGSSGAGGGYGYMWNSGSPYSMMASYYQLHGLNASEIDGPSLNTVISEVKGGYPYTLCNGLTSVGHIIVINGVGNKTGTLIVNDPYGNKNSAGGWPNYYGKDTEYDWPGYNNGYQNLNDAYWGVSVRYTPPVWPDSIVCDLDFGTGTFGSDGFTLKNTPPASMSLWLDRNAGYDGHAWYIYTRQSDTCAAEWRPVLKQDGNYEVSAYIYFSNPGSYFRIANNATYHVHYGGDSAAVVIDQSQGVDGMWASLGTYPFAAGDSGYVELGDGTGASGQILIVNAMKWSYQSPLLVERNPSSLPASPNLEQNYPNPFNPTTEIRYQTSEVSFVTIKIYDVIGREMATLVNERQDPGTHTAIFDASRFPSGMYFCQLKTGSYTATKKMLMIK